jgi:hypothetical protein
MKNGIVRVIKSGQLLPTPFIDLSAKVNTSNDHGLWGLASDPHYRALSEDPSGDLSGYSAGHDTDHGRRTARTAQPGTRLSGASPRASPARPPARSTSGRTWRRPPTA